MDYARDLRRFKKCSNRCFFRGTLQLMCLASNDKVLVLQTWLIVCDSDLVKKTGIQKYGTPIIKVLQFTKAVKWKRKWRQLLNNYYNSPVAEDFMMKPASLSTLYITIYRSIFICTYKYPICIHKKI